MAPLRAALLSLLASLAACAAADEHAAQIKRNPAASADHVLIVSVDGLRADALTDLTRLPNFARLLGGAFTLDARCDPDWSVTLPNHVGMLTGRFAEGMEGHGWALNDMPPPGLYLRAGQRSALHYARRADLRTAMFAGKEKFVLFPRSWNGADSGDPRGTIQHYAWSASASESTRGICAFWAGGETASLVFAHISEPDQAGHAEGWDLAPGSPYLAAVAQTDAALGEILAWLDARPERLARTGIVLTSDHGGGKPFKNHTGEGRALLNTRIPFLVWRGDGQARGDLYAMNAETRRAPGEDDPRREEIGLPPLRNLDAAAVALMMLGLPQLPSEGGGGAAPPRLLPAVMP